MRDLLPHLQRWRDDGEEIAMATVVAVRGSAPRPVGARLAVTRSGRMAGSVSGGCVESDVILRALQVLDGGRPLLVRYDGVGDDDDLSVGLACSGSIDVLIEAFEEGPAWQALRGAFERERPVVLAVATSPGAELGRKLVIGEGTDPIGSIDPAADDRCIAAARRLLPTGGSALVEATTAEGEVRVFVEAFSRRPSLIIVGATHTAISLCRMAAELGYRVTVIDPREVFATKERFPEAHALVGDWPEEALDQTALDGDTHVVTLTHDPKFDLPALARALHGETGYIGALGSRATHVRRVERLREQGFTDADLARICTPVGLDIGALSPEEIALSILAEMVALRRGRDGGALRLRNAPIHDDD